jgi:formate dehydrogenase major subunit
VSDSDDPGTVCPRCAVGCHLAPRGDGGRARGVAGPANPNGRLCRSGVGAFDVAHGDRLTRPQIRRGGGRRTVPWSTAYDRVAERFGAILDAHGPDALAFLGAPHCTNEENYLLQKLARTLGTNNVDNRARLCHAATARTLSERVGRPATTNRLADLAEADVIVVAGANPADRQPVAFNSFVRPAVDDGATLVHVDPVGNRTTRLADVHLAPRPGTDALVFDAVSARVDGRGDGVDRTFVAERTRGYDRFAASLADLDPRAAAAAAGVDDGALARVAALVADADRVAALVGTGIDETASGATPAGPLLDLLLLTGNLGRPGTGLYVLRGLVNEQGATDAGCVPDRLPGHRPVTDPEARARIASEWGTAPPASPGRSAEELLAAFGDEVRGALVVGENPAISKRDRQWVRRRLDALDALVVLDLVSSETTRRADVVLPAAAGVEKAGTVTNLERRVQRSRPAAAPPGEARPDFAILRDLGGRLVERPGAFDYPDVGTVFDELTRVAPIYAGVSYADLDRDGAQWPFDGDGVLYRDAFDTPDGRAAFGTSRATAALSPGDRLSLVTTGRASERGDRGGDRRLRIHPADASERGIGPADAVVVSSGEATVETTAALDRRVREGTVALPAGVADPLLRRDATTVTVGPAAESTDGPGDPDGAA